MADKSNAGLHPNATITLGTVRPYLIILSTSEDVEKFRSQCDGQNIVLRTLGENVLLLLSDRSTDDLGALLNSLAMPRDVFALIELGAYSSFTPKA